MKILIDPMFDRQPPLKGGWSLHTDKKTTAKTVVFDEFRASETVLKNLLRLTKDLLTDLLDRTWRAVAVATNPSPT